MQCRITIGQFVERFERIYGDIRENRKVFASAHYKYYGTRFDWEPYEYYVRIPNHTRVEFDSFMADRILHSNIRKHIHQECVGVMAHNIIVHDKKY